MTLCVTNILEFGVAYLIIELVIGIVMEAVKCQKMFFFMDSVLFPRKDCSKEK